MHQQGALAGRPDTGDVIERIGDDGLGALLPMGADRKAMRLVPQALKVEENRRIDRQRQFTPVRQVKHLAAGVPVRTLCASHYSALVLAPLLKPRSEASREWTESVSQSKSRCSPSHS